MFIVASVSVVGCRVGPDYEQPEFTEAESPWRADVGEARIDGINEVLVDERDEEPWWRAFGDPQLEGLIGKLARESLDLALARERIVEARARRGLSSGEWWPRLDATAGYSRIGSGDDSLLLGAAPPGVETDLYSLGGVAAWEVDLWGRVARQVEAADAEIEATTYDYHAAFVSLSAELAIAYFDARALDARVRNLEAQVALDEERLLLARSLEGAGTGTATEVANAARAVAASQARVSELRRARAAAENSVAILLGERPRDGLFATAAESAPTPTPPPVIGLGLPSQLLTRRADIREAERHYRAAVARIGAAQAEHFPRLTLSGTFTLQADQAKGLFDDSLIYAFGPRLAWPVFAGGLIESAVRVQESRAEQARLALRRTLLRALGEVETAAVGTIESRRRVMALEIAVSEAARAAELAAQRHRAGLSSRLESIAAERERLRAEDELAIARQSALDRSVILYRALGGGWERSPAIAEDPLLETIVPPEASDAAGTKEGER